MSFDVTATAYDGFMGRYSRLLSGQLADLAAVDAGQRALDVGCGTGALTGSSCPPGRGVGGGGRSVTSFVAATRERHPGVDVHQASAEHLPFPSGEFDTTLAQLVVHFMADPVRGLTEMRRVTRPGGILAACVWDHAGRRGTAQAVLGRGPVAGPGSGR